VLGTRVYICKPADPEGKGMIERFHDYLKTSFLPGRTFTRARGLQHSAHRMARVGQRPPQAGAGLCPG